MLRTSIDRLRAGRRDDRGFTLIELLIVIIILGVLAAIVVFSVRGITQNGEEAACKTEFRIVDTAIEAFYAETGAYPATATPVDRLEELVDGGFLKSVPDEYVTGVSAYDDNATPADTTDDTYPAATGPAAC